MPTVRRVSYFWLASPFALLLLANTFVLFSGQHYSPAELYFGSQINWFKSLNFELNKLPPAFWSNITQLGEAVVLLPIVFVLTINKRQSWLAVIYSIPAASLLSVLLKRLTSVPRPAAIIENNEMVIIGKTLIGHTSFPSGHTITVFAVSIAILMSLYPSINKHKERAILFVLLTLSMLISLSRVAVGAHWPLDLFVGAACGWLAGFSGVYILNKLSDQFDEHSQWGTKWDVFFICLFSILSILLFIRSLSFTVNNLIVIVALLCSLVIVSRLLKQIKNKSIKV